MTEKQLIIGAEVRCTDGVCGRLHRVVVDPAERRLTHLAVKQDGWQAGRLVPAEQVAAGGADILLRCTAAEFARFESAEVTAQEHAASWPYSAPELGGRFPAGVEGIERDTGYGNRTTIRDRIPAGGIEVRRGEIVYAADGEFGRARGLIIDVRDQHVTYLLVDKGQLWRRRRIAVPVESVTTFGDGIQLDLTRAQVRDLPRVPLDGEA